MNFYHILFSDIKENRCLKNVIHQIDRNEWLLLSTFQQGLRFLYQHRKTLFLRGFNLRLTERA